MTDIMVIDASVVVDLIGQFEAKPVADLMFAGNAILCAPELLDILMRVISYFCADE